MSMLTETLAPNDWLQIYLNCFDVALFWELTHQDWSILLDTNVKGRSRHMS